MSKNGSSSSSSSSSVSAVSTMTSVEALDLSVMGIKVSRSEAERKSMEIQLKSSMVEMDELKETVESLHVQLGTVVLLVSGCNTIC